MGKLVKKNWYNLFGVSKRPDKDGRYQLVRLPGKAFNQHIVSSEIKNTLTNLTNSLYHFEKGSRWYEITGDMCKDGVVEIGIEHNQYVLIPKIIDRIALGEGSYRFFVVVNEGRTEYQWITAVGIGTAYTDAVVNLVGH